MVDYCCDVMKELDKNVSGMDFKERAMLVSAGYDETRLIDIKYCPFCGRRLES